MKPLFQVTILLTCVFLDVRGNDDVRVVRFSGGLVRGSLMKSSDGRDYLSFRGIPYAKPPVGELRFRDPVENDPWTGILDGTKEGPTCLQYNFFLSTTLGTEDCLYLNIYTHEIDEAATKRPVMVWIHGGSFQIGSGNGETDYYGADHLLNNDIVLVTINYRLGPLGFLSTDDEVAPGNFGLLDQSLALHWVKKNIEAFGGDSNSITIFGESAGAASVELQLLSQRNQGLFHRAIAQSGSALCSWAVSDSVKNYSTQLAAHLNCPVGSSKDLVDCLRKKDGTEIVEFRKQLQSFTFLPMVFAPRVDKERKDPFLAASPKEILESGRFNQVPFITGATENEGAFMVSTLVAENGAGMKTLEGDLASGMPLLLDMETLPDGKEKSLQAVKRYLGEKLPSQDLHTFERIMSDRLFFSCLQDSLDLHAKHNKAPKYAYIYTHLGKITFSTITGGSSDFGVSHADDILVMFSGPLSKTFKSEDDKKVSKIIIDYWTSFAKDGVPKIAESKSQWLPVSQSMKYMNINLYPVLVEADFPFSERLPFWKELLPEESHGTETGMKTEL